MKHSYSIIVSDYHVSTTTLKIHFKNCFHSQLLQTDLFRR